MYANLRSILVCFWLKFCGLFVSTESADFGRNFRPFRLSALSALKKSSVITFLRVRVLFRLRIL
jgi:hypothetical protein